MPAHERSSIIYSHDHAAAMTHPDFRAERQSTMRSRHCRAVNSFAVCRAASASAIRSAVYARDFSTSAARAERC